MAITSGFFNSLNGDRKYNAIQMSSIFDGLIKDGVFAHVGDAFRVTPGSGMNVTLGTGRAWFSHVWVLNDSAYQIELSSADPTLSRIDAVVLEINSNTSVRASRVYIQTGTVAVAPMKPTVSNESGITRVILAYVKVIAGSSNIFSDDITSNVGTDACPYVTGILESISVDAIYKEWDEQFQNAFSKWQTEFETWFKSVSQNLSGDVVTNMQQQIETIKKDYLPRVDKATVEEGIAGIRDDKYITPKVLVQVPASSVLIWGQPHKILDAVISELGVESDTTSVSISGGGVNYDRSCESYYPSDGSIIYGHVTSTSGGVLSFVTRGLTVSGNAVYGITTTRGLSAFQFSSDSDNLMTTIYSGSPGTSYLFIVTPGAGGNMSRFWLGQMPTVYMYELTLSRPNFHFGGMLSNGSVIIGRKGSIAADIMYMDPNALVLFYGTNYNTYKDLLPILKGNFSRIDGSYTNGYPNNWAVNGLAVLNNDDIAVYIHNPSKTGTISWARITGLTAATPNPSMAGFVQNVAINCGSFINYNICYADNNYAYFVRLATNGIYAKALKVGLYDPQDVTSFSSASILPYPSYFGTYASNANLESFNQAIKYAATIGDTAYFILYKNTATASDNKAVLFSINTNTLDIAYKDITGLSDMDLSKYKRYASNERGFNVANSNHFISGGNYIISDGLLTIDLTAGTLIEPAPGMFIHRKYNPNHYVSAIGTVARNSATASVSRKRLDGTYKVSDLIIG